MDSFFAFSIGDSNVCNSLFSHGCSYLLFSSQCQLSTSDNTFESVEFFMQVGSAFRRIKGFHFQFVFCLPPAVLFDKQISVPRFSNVFWIFICKSFRTIVYRLYCLFFSPQNFGRCILRPSTGVPCLSGHRNDSTREVIFKVWLLNALFDQQSNCKNKFLRLNHFYAQINRGHLRKARGYSGRNARKKTQ